MNTEYDCSVSMYFKVYVNIIKRLLVLGVRQ